MQLVIFQAAVLVLCGVLWRVYTPRGLGADALRHALTSLVYVLLLPALVLGVLWRAPLGLDAARVALAALVGLATGYVGAWLLLRVRRPPPATFGALLLAATFPNATYLGLPVLEAALGPWARSIAIQYDLFACTPLLLSAGVLAAAHYGGSRDHGHPLAELLRVPPLWAAVAAVALNAAAVPQPEAVAGLLKLLGDGVVPLMLISIGLGLRWEGSWWQRLPQVLPVLVVQLLLTPLVVWGVSGPLGLTGDMRVAVVLEAAMPSMVLGIVICDRFHLDTGVYAMAVTLTTALSLVTLPLWFDLLR